MFFLLLANPPVSSILQDLANIAAADRDGMVKVLHQYQQAKIFNRASLPLSAGDEHES